MILCDLSQMFALLTAWQNCSPLQLAWLLTFLLIIWLVFCRIRVHWFKKRVLRVGKMVADWPGLRLVGDGPWPMFCVGGDVVAKIGFWNDLDHEERAAVLAHERGHIRFRDESIYWALSFLLTLIPLVVVLSRGICALNSYLVGLLGLFAFVVARVVLNLMFHFWVEQRADRFSVLETGNPLALASGLVKAMKMTRSAPMGLMCLVNRWTLRWRFHQLLKWAERPPKPFRSFAVFRTIGALFLLWIFIWVMVCGGKLVLEDANCSQAKVCETGCS